jgi:predicted nuclease of predicted toxin-antitoxin system
VIRLLLDQGLPRSTCAILLAEGWDVVHVCDIGMSQAADPAILDCAVRDNRIVVTLDADFHAHLVLSGASRPSVIRIRIEGLRGDALAGLLRHSWPKIKHVIDDGAMVTVTHTTLRIRTLPVTL